MYDEDGLGCGCLCLLVLLLVLALAFLCLYRCSPEPPPEPQEWVALTERFDGLPEKAPHCTQTYIITDRETGASYLALVTNRGREVQLTDLGANIAAEEGETA